MRDVLITLSIVYGVFLGIGLIVGLFQSHEESRYTTAYCKKTYPIDYVLFGSRKLGCFLTKEIE